jgi:hypothetical protein
VVIDTLFHRALARHGGDAVLRPLLPARAIAEYRTISGGCGVYIACDGHDRVMYVGSVHRPGNTVGISTRIGEHMGDALKALRWERLWVLVVSDDQTVEWVRTYEAILGEELQPTWNERLPAL